MKKIRLIDKLIKKAIYIVISIICATIVGLILLVSVYKLPSEMMLENVRRSSNIQAIESDRYDWAPEVLSSAIDGFTDAIMLNMAIYTSSDGPLKNAIDNVCLKDESLTQSYADILSYEILPQDYSNISEWHYGIYWHGYLVYLKPLLLLFSYGEIRVILMALQMFLVLWFFFLFMQKVHNSRLAIPFMIAIILVNPITNALCLQLSDIYTLTLLGGITLLSIKSVYKNYFKVFLWLGIITAYVDLLTYPLLALCFNLVLFCFITVNTNKWKEQLTQIIIASVMWVLGYALMWMSKWVVLSIYVKGAVKSALSEVVYRTVSDSTVSRYINSTSIFNAFTANLRLLLTRPAVLIIVLSVIGLVFLTLKNKYKFRLTNKLYSLIFIGLYPVIWCLIVRQHSAVHAVFVHRIIVIDILVILSIIYDSVVRD